MPTRERRLQEAARRRALDTPPEGAERVMAEERYWCRWPSGFTYGGLALDAGQVFALRQLRNDADLVRLGYVRPLEGKPRLAHCGVCGAQFLDEARRDSHGRKRHSGRGDAPTGTPAGAGLALEDRTGAAEDRLNEAALRGGDV